MAAIRWPSDVGQLEHIVEALRVVATDFIVGEREPTSPRLSAALSPLQCEARLGGDRTAT